MNFAMKRVLENRAKNWIMLPWFLNRTASIPQRNRVLALLEKMRRLAAIYEAQRANPAAERRNIMDIVKIDPPADAAALQNEINHDLARYPIRHAISGASLGDPGLWVLPHNLRDGEKVAAQRRDGNFVVTESEAVGMLVSLAADGLLDRIRQCGWRECEKWYIASRRDQRFCSEPCKRKHQRSSPQFKAHRAEYMRKRYEKLFKKEKA
jgi:hypothetical protein